MQKKKSGCLWPLIKISGVIILIAVLTLWLLFHFFGGAYTAVKNDISSKLWGKDSAEMVVNVNDSIVIDTPKIVIGVPKGRTVKTADKATQEIPIEVTDHGVFITAEVNTVPMRFMLDTGCSDVMLTSAELYYLSHMGLIDVNKQSGTAMCKYANGDSKECPVYTLKSIKLGNAEVNDVSCTIEEHADVMPLLGQSVIKALGKMHIDYENKKLIIEDEK